MHVQKQGFFKVCMYKYFIIFCNFLGMFLLQKHTKLKKYFVWNCHFHWLYYLRILLHKLFFPIMVIVAWRRDIWAMLGSNVQLESFGCVFIRNFRPSIQFSKWTNFSYILGMEVAEFPSPKLHTYAKWIFLNIAGVQILLIFITYKTIQPSMRKNCSGKLEFQCWRPRIYENFEFTRTLHLNSEWLICAIFQTECFSNLFPWGFSDPIN